MLASAFRYTEHLATISIESGLGMEETDDIVYHRLRNSLTCTVEDDSHTAAIAGIDY